MANSAQKIIQQCRRPIPQLCFAAAATVTAYWPSLFYGFAQDDFIHLAASQAHSMGDVLQFFNPYHQYEAIFFYRPLATQFLFFVVSHIFGYQPVVFHLVGLFFHVANVCLIYLLVRKMWQRNWVAFLTSLLYGIGAIHFLSLYYISSFQETMRMTAMLVGFWFGYLYYGRGRFNDLILTLISFIAGLLAKETSLVFPFLIFVFLILADNVRQTGNNWRRLWWLTIPLIVITIIYAAIRLLGLHLLFSQGGYQISLTLQQLLQNGKWYVVWSLGLPELLASYPHLSLSTFMQFGRDFSEGNAILVTAAIVLFYVISWFCLTVKTHWKTYGYTFIFVLISLLPILFLTAHKYPQYLDIGYVVLLPAILSPVHFAKGWQWKVQAVVVGFGCGAFILLQAMSLHVTMRTHWATHRAQVADYYATLMKTGYPDLPKQTTIRFIGTAQALVSISTTLADRFAWQVWYPGKVGRIQYLTPDQAQRQPAVPGTITIPLDRY